MVEKTDPQFLVALVPKFKNLAKLVKNDAKLLGLLGKAAKREYPDADTSILQSQDAIKFFHVFESNNILENASDLTPHDIVEVALAIMDSPSAGLWVLGKKNDVWYWFPVFFCLCLLDVQIRVKVKKR